MKKVFLFAAVAAMAVMSCKKDDPIIPNKPDNSQKTYPVNFNISSFGQEELSYKSLINFWGSIEYLVYDANGNFVKQTVNPVYGSTASSFSDSLAAGTYNISFIAVDTTYGYSALGWYPWNINYADYIGRLHSNRDGVFAKTMQIAITDSNSYSVTLKRITGKIEVIATDTIFPAHIKRVVIVAENLADTSFSLISLKGSGTFFRQYDIFNRGIIANRTAEFLSYAADALPQRRLVAIGYDNSNMPVYTKIIAANFAIPQNKRIRFTGRIFGDQTMGFQVYVDDAYDGVSEIYF